MLVFVQHVHIHKAVYSIFPEGFALNFTSDCYIKMGFVPFLLPDKWKVPGTHFRPLVNYMFPHCCVQESEVMKESRPYTIYFKCWQCKWELINLISVVTKTVIIMMGVSDHALKLDSSILHTLHLLALQCSQLQCV